MYRFFALLLLISIALPAFSQRTVITRQPYYNPYYRPNYYSNAYYGGDYNIHNPRYRYGRQTPSMFADINDLEKYALNKNYYRENDRSRLERLERLAFGAVQEGDMYSRYNNVRNAILTRPQQNYKTSLLKSIGNYFTGQLTGYTPSINDLDNSAVFPFDNTNFGQSSVDSYVTPWSKGYHTNNYGVGSSSGVHILD